MKKGVLLLIVLTIMECCIVGCVSGSKIEMPHDDSYYENGDWMLEDLVAHFEEMGFTDIKTISHETYRVDPYTVYHVGINEGLSDTGDFEAGDVFNSYDEITISYHSQKPTLTIENCPDLATVLTSKEMDYMEFANKYDGQYILFDGYVYEHIIYMGGTSHIINVAGGDYSAEGYSGLIIRVDEEIVWGADIDEDVKEGEHVKVVGVVDASQCEYYKMLYVKGIYLNTR